MNSHGSSWDFGLSGDEGCTGECPLGRASSIAQTGVDGERLPSLSGSLMTHSDADIPRAVRAERRSHRANPPPDSSASSRLTSYSPRTSMRTSWASMKKSAIPYLFSPPDGFAQVRWIQRQRPRKRRSVLPEQARDCGTRPMGRSIRIARTSPDLPARAPERCGPKGSDRAERQSPPGGMVV
jgi:hypothetical protein